MLSFATTTSVTVNFDFFTDFSSQLDDYTLTVNGADMEEVSQTVSADDTSTTIDVPIGPDRTFNVVAPTTSSLDSAVFDYRGNSTVDVSSSGASIDVTLGIGETALVIPDQQLNISAPRVVRVDDMDVGTRWTESTFFSSSMTVNDVEVGPLGLIHVAGDFSDWQGVLSFANVDDTNFDGQLVNESGVRGIAIDEKEGVLFYAGDIESGFLGAVALDGSTATPTDYSTLVDDLSTIWGVTVDDAGDVYVSGQTLETQDPFPIVRKIAPSTEQVIWTKTYEAELPTETGSDEHVDITHNSDSLFITNPSGKDGSKILRLDPQNGDILDRFGTTPSDLSNPQPDDLYAPRRFVATNRSKLYVIDDFGDMNSTVDNRIVGFDASLDGSGWETYGSEGQGNDEFDFYLAY